METDTCTHVHCSSLYHGHRDMKQLRPTFDSCQGGRFLLQVDHSIQTKTLTSPLAHNGNQHVSLRSPQGRRQGDVVRTTVWNIHSPQRSHHPPGILRTLPCQPVAAPTDLVSHFLRCPECHVKTLRILPVLKIGLALWLHFLWEEPPSSLVTAINIVDDKGPLLTWVHSIRARLTSQNQPSGATRGLHCWPALPGPPRAQYTGAAQEWPPCSPKSAHQPSGSSSRT